MRSPRFISQRSLSVAFCALSILAATGCDGGSDDRSPTAPDLIVAGSWAGTVSVTDEFDTCDGPAAATFEQNGLAVSGTLTTGASLGCGAGNRYRFEGTLEGNLVRGSMILPDDSSWTTSGELSGERLTLLARFDLDDRGGPRVYWDLRR